MRNGKIFKVGEYIRNMENLQEKVGQETAKGSLSSERKYSTFAEMYLEEPIYSQGEGITCTMCTWRGIPTIDDW